ALLEYWDSGSRPEKYGEGFGTTIIKGMATQLGLSYVPPSGGDKTFSFIRQQINQADHGTGYILCIEADVSEALRHRSELQTAGFSVDENILTTGEDAFAYVRSRLSTPGCLLVSVSLGGKADGIQTANNIRQLYPDLPIVFLADGMAPDISLRLYSLENASQVRSDCSVDELILAIGKAGYKKT
ncbi:MAG: hypothetical protein ACOCWH_01570, partial [Spirochaetota bacterium]